MVSACVCAGQATACHKQLLDSQMVQQASAPHEPAWFERVPGSHKIGEEYLFRYKGGYWAARAAGALAKQ